MTKNATRTAIGLLVALGLVLFAPMAAAQSPTFDFQLSNKPTSPITPLEQTHNIKVTWTYTLPGSAIQEAIGQGTGSVALTFSYACTPDQLVVTGDLTPIVAFNAAGNNAGEYDGEFELSVTPTRQAPGLEPIRCSITGSAASGGQSNAIPASNTKSQDFTVTPDFYSLIEASAPVKLSQGGPQKEVPYTIDVVNFGNAQTRVNFAFLEGATPGGGWQGLLPDQLILDAPGGDRSSAQATFTVSTPFKNGWNNDQGAYTLTLKPESAVNADKKGPEVQITILTRVRGVYVPSLEPLVMLGAVIGTALIARQLKDEE